MSLWQQRKTNRFKTSHLYSVIFTRAHCTCRDMEVKTEVEENLKPSKSGEVLFPNENRYSHIRNKQVRNQQFQKKKREVKKVK